MSKSLIIVESPAKVKTIKKYVGSEYEVTSCYGHIRDLPKKKDAIDIQNHFKPTYIITDDKKKVVRQLRSMVKNKDHIYLASDYDREGEAIAWHLKEALNLKGAKVRRIIFREITKNAILEALGNPRKIDENLVNAQQARRILDRIVGFELSPVLWKKVKPHLSAGRVQSPAVRLIVEKEREIIQFSPKAYFKIIALFQLPNQNILKAELKDTLGKLEEVEKLFISAKEAKFFIQDIQKKESKRTPSAPFTTATLQQEASNQLGYAVSRTMLLAQKLYEAGHISYMRTDSVNLSQEALQNSAKVIQKEYGKEFLKTRQYQTKSSTAQEAHEAIRPTNFAQKRVTEDHSLQRLYTLIWKRTIASQMSDAEIEKTTVTINMSNTDKQFLAKGEIIQFEGFLKVYEKIDEKKDETTRLPDLKVRQTLNLQMMNAKESFTKPPARYTEASLVKKLESLGIGRPSTYAPIIATIQKRGYVVNESREGIQKSYTLVTLKEKEIKVERHTEIIGNEKNKLFPDNIAMVVNDFLRENCAMITNYDFTAEIEQELDQIAENKKHWIDMLNDFYTNFNKKIQTLNQEDTVKVKKVRLLGKDPKTGLPVYTRIGKYGGLVQIGEPKEKEEKDPSVKFASLPKNYFIETITLEEALKLFDLPRNLGLFEEDKLIVNKGRFGPYIKHKENFYSIRNQDPYKITLSEAIECIQDKRKQDQERIIKVFEEHPEIQILKSRFGPYIHIQKKDMKPENVRIPKEINPEELTYKACLQLIEEKKKSLQTRITTKK